MKGPVAHGDIGAAVARRGVEFVEGALRRRALLIPRDRRREPGGARFDRKPERENLVGFPRRHPPHEIAAVGLAGEQAFLFEPCQRLARSEEHTSELQSLMRISYAVFCLKKKHIKTTTP